MTLRGCSHGARTYLATRGGFLTEIILGSRSRSGRLEAGELLPAAPSTTLPQRLSLDRVNIESAIRVLDGPDAHACRFDEWAGRAWRVGPQCDRVGVRLEAAEPVRTSVASDSRSVPVAPGTVQLAGGLPMILGPSCGTMGGYPIAAMVISADLDRIGQLRPGDLVCFSRVELAEARRLDVERRETVQRFCERIRNRVGQCGGTSVGE